VIGEGGGMMTAAAAAKAVAAEAVANEWRVQGTTAYCNMYCKALALAM
jgi:hypothetical protein